ncbi:MAG: nucleoside phosphorylase, partial [Actinomycetia bacterium]|nr:nucleoside phosphorylase [Actinomycetes bacterium]
MNELRRVGILAPMPSELRPVAKVLGLERDGTLGGRPLYRGRHGTVEVVATGTGIGPTLAADAASNLLAEFGDLDRVVVSGIAGGIAPATAVGDLVVPAEVVDAATGERFIATPPAGVAARGVIRMGAGDDYTL